MTSLLRATGRALGRIANNAPVPYVGRGSGFSFARPQSASATESLEAFGSVGTLFAIAGRNANAVSQVEWHLYRKSRSGKKEDRVEVTSHAVLDLWNAPNPFYTRQEFVESVQQHVELVGEGWPLISRSPRSPLPLELWFARPDRMQPVPDPITFIRGYVYTGPDGEKIPLDVTEAKMIRVPNPMDPYRGMGAVQSILIDLDSTRYSAEWNRNFFLNSAEPGGIIEVEQRLGDPEFDELSRRWNEQHRGVKRAHRVAIIEQGKWVDRKFTMRDMQFVELRNVSRETIREAFGFPKPLLGAVDDVNRANAEAAEVVYARWNLLCRLERWKQFLNNDLLPLYGKDAATGLEWDYESPVPEDKEAEDRERTSKTTTAVALIGAGFTAESVVEAYDLPATLVWEKPDPPVIPAPNADPNAKPAPEKAAGNQTRRWAIRNASADATHPAHSVDLSGTQDDFEQARDAVLAGWANEVTPAQYDSIERQVQIAIDHGDVTGLTSINVSAVAGTALLALVMTELAAAAGDRVREEARAQGVTIPTTHFQRATFQPYAETAAELLAAGLATAAGREALRVFIPGAAGVDVAAQVIKHLQSLSDAFLRDQIGGALTRAQNMARLATLGNGPVARYFASEVLDRNTCGPCEKIDGQELPTLEAATLAYGGGPYLFCEGGVRCRGTAVGVWTEHQGDTGMNDRTSRSTNGHAMPARLPALTGRVTNLTTLDVPARPSWWSGAETAPAATNSTGKTWYRIENKATDAADVYLYDEIGGWGVTAANFVKELADVSAKTINLKINSPGGDVFDGVAIFNALRTHAAAVNATVDGYAASAASFIAMAADTITMQRGSQMMIHDAQGVAYGDASVMAECGALLNTISDMIASLYAERAGGDTATWRKTMKATTWYTAEEAVAAGLADVAVSKPESEPDDAKPDNRIPARPINVLPDDPTVGIPVADDDFADPHVDRVDIDFAALFTSTTEALAPPVIEWDADIFRAAMTGAGNNVAMPVITRPDKGFSAPDIDEPESVPVPAPESNGFVDLFRAALGEAGRDIALPNPPPPIVDTGPPTVDPLEFRRALEEASQ